MVVREANDQGAAIFAKRKSGPVPEPGVNPVAATAGMRAVVPQRAASVASEHRPRSALEVSGCEEKPKAPARPALLRV